MAFDKERVKKRAFEILLDMVAVGSFTGTSGEKGMEAFFQRFFDGVPYLKEHPENCGFRPIANDPLGRTVPFAFLKGEGDGTVVFVHHTDVVGTDDYKALKPLALKPLELEAALKEGKLELDDEAKADLQSGEWLFGRGVADMKGGGSVQLALFEEYSKQKDFKGNIVVIGVGDEENLSAGMHGAIGILKELREKHDLNYVLLLNCEPDKRLDGISKLTDGSIGKILPVVYARGVQAHCGRVFQGLNATHLLSEIVSRTDANSDFCEKSGNTVSPPPSWLYARDTKQIYDVTYPLSACGCMNLFMLEKTPEEHMNRLFDIAKEAMDEVIRVQNENFRRYAELSGLDLPPLPYKTSVKMFREIYDEAIRDSGDKFKRAYEGLIPEIKGKISKNEMTTYDGAKLLIETALSYRSDLSSVVVIGLAPPYYPAVNNAMIREKMEPIDRAISSVVRYAKENYGADYQMDSYYVDISDLSYGMFTPSDKAIEYIEDNMLLWRDVYYIPLADIKELSMPVLNVGPYGKSIHQHAERVHKEELFGRVPALIDVIFADLFGNE